MLQAFETPTYVDQIAVQTPMQSGSFFQFMAKGRKEISKFSKFNHRVLLFLIKKGQGLIVSVVSLKINDFPVEFLQDANSRKQCNCSIC